MKSNGHSRKKKPSGPLHYCVFDSPVGKIMLAGSRTRLKLVSFQDGPHPMEPDANWIRDDKPFTKAIGQFRSYFAGTRKEFSLPIEPEGTPFQLRVWKQLQRIPYGKTISYGTLAKEIGKPAASRAVGAANGQNPLSIVIPCHRVIGQNGKLVGFGGGLPIKASLLAIEQRSLTH